jgi:hypothetical protein
LRILRQWREPAGTLADPFASMTLLTPATLATSAYRCRFTSDST